MKTLINKIKSFGALILVAWCVVFAPIAVTGCKSVNQTAFRTVQSVDITADVAMRAWGVYVREGHPGVEAERRVESAFNAYLATAMFVADAGVALSKADNQSTRVQLDIALAAAAAALGNLTNLIAAFGVNLK